MKKQVLFMVLLLSMTAVVSAQKTISDLISESVNKVQKPVEKPVVSICGMVGNAVGCGLVRNQVSKIVSGIVTDEEGAPLVGASIVIKGTNEGVITDINGWYSMPIADSVQKLLVAFVGFEKQTIDVKNTKAFDARLKIDVKVLAEFVVIGYSCIVCRHGCCCCGISTENISWEYKLDPKMIENGATKLNYVINTTQHVRYKDDLPDYKAWHEAKNKVHYTISKSTDDFSYKQIGTSESGNKPTVYPKNDSTLTEWGGSQFVDKEPNEADSTYYLVEGYVVDENTEERRLVYRQKTVVLPTKSLKINNLYHAPKSNWLEINLSNATDGKADFMVSDMSGRVLHKQQTALFKDNNNLVLTCEGLVTGVYVLSVRQNGRLASRKFVVLN